MPESTPALLPAVLLMSAAAGFVLLGVWAASPHRRPPFRRSDRRERRRGRQPYRRRGRRDPGPHASRGPAGAGRSHAERHRDERDRFERRPPEPPVPLHPVVDPARRPLR